MRKECKFGKAAGTGGRFPAMKTMRAIALLRSGRRGRSAAKDPGQGGWLTRGTLLPPLQQRDCLPVRRGVLRKLPVGRHQASTPIWGGGCHEPRKRSSENWTPL